MKRFFQCFCLVFLIFSGAEQAKAQDQTAIRQIIDNQMAAFQADNGELAFSFAAPSIRQMFKTADNFMNMVKQGYNPVYRPAEVDFRDFYASGNQFIQRVFIRGANGEAVMATYSLEKMPDGSLKITACQIEKLPELAA